MPIFAPETILADEYVVERLLGQGGMAVVYLCRDPGLDREVAVKVVNDELLLDRDARLRFVQEARTMARLEHHNVMPVLRVIHRLDLAAMVMPYYEGESLATRLDRTPGVPLAEVEALDIFEQIVAAVGAAHESSPVVVHRDINPNNVYLAQVRGEPRALLMDFGIAKVLAEGPLKTRAGAVIGTVAYMAPERIQVPTESGTEADVFSLGVMLYEMLTGQQPFVADTELMLPAAIVQDPVPLEPLESLQPSLRALVLRCLEKDPLLRYGTATELVEALAQLPSAPKDPEGQVADEPPDEPGYFIICEGCSRRVFRRSGPQYAHPSDNLCADCFSARSQREVHEAGGGGQFDSRGVYAGRPGSGRSGTMRLCPGCGASLAMWLTTCPLCGAELGGGGSSEQGADEEGDRAESRALGADPALPPGTRLADGRYLLGEVVASDSLSRVYGGWRVPLPGEPPLAPEVAIEELSARFLVPWTEERLPTAGEIASLARVRERVMGLAGLFATLPFPLRPLETFEQASSLLLVSRLPPSQSLDDWLEARDAPVPEERALQMALDLARELATLERHGCLFRVIKPGAIALSEDGGAHLLSFCWACRWPPPDDGKTEQIWTPGYSAPEQCPSEPPRGRSVPSPRSEVFGLSAVLYRMLVGRPPYGYDNYILQAPPPDTIAETHVSAALSAVVMRGISLDPDERYQTVAELEGALQKCFEQRSWELRRGAKAAKPKAMGKAQGQGQEGDASNDSSWWERVSDYAVPALAIGPVLSVEAVVALARSRAWPFVLLAWLAVLGGSAWLFGLSSGWLSVVLWAHGIASGVLVVGALLRRWVGMGGDSSTPSSG